VQENLDFEIDASLSITHWGRSIATITGMQPSAALGKKYHEILPRIALGDEDALSYSVSQQEDISLKDYRMNCFSGHMVADITISLTRDGRRGVRGARVRIAPSVECSAVSKLRQSQRLIDLGKIASALAHGVRNPLNAIKGAVVYLGERYAEDPTLAEFTKIMDDEIGRLDHFISKFLSTSLADFAAPEIDVNAVLRRVEVLTSLQLQAVNIRPVFQLGDVPGVLANSFHIEQAVLNIINNAMEAMGSNGTIFVRSMGSRRNGTRYAVIEIVDEGPGFASGAQQIGVNHSEKQGRGFGLFLTRETIQYCGGHMEIKSSKGKGTTVRLYLPPADANKGEHGR
jgi:two-component system nitrogen regulation sensor histidine kinase GlnL